TTLLKIAVRLANAVISPPLGRRWLCQQVLLRTSAPLDLKMLMQLPSLSKMALLSITKPPPSPSSLQQAPTPLPRQQAWGAPDAVQPLAQTGASAQSRSVWGRPAGAQVPSDTSRMMPCPSVSPAHSHPPVAGPQSRATQRPLWQSASPPHPQP